MITPKGFFKDFLETQLSGLTGNIAVAGYPFNEVEWGMDDYLSTKVNKDCKWWPYEQTAYWLDGYVRVGILLKDEKVIENASRIIYNAIDKADETGYIGPKFMKNVDSWSFRWPHVVFFRACIALYDYNKDEKIINALTKHYLNDDVIRSKGRDVLNVEIMCLLYERNGNDDLIKIAEKNYQLYQGEEWGFWTEENILSKNKMFIHGVTYHENMKLPMLLYKHTGNKRYLKVALALSKRIEKYYYLPGCIANCDEYFESNYYYNCYETCDITDYTWSLSYYLKTLNDARYGDLIEKCVFNAGMGSILENFRGLQYMSCANQLIASDNSTHCECYRGNKQMSYRPNPFTECCPGNVNRFMPNYILNMWRTEGTNVYCDLFGSSEYTTSVRDKSVKIVEETAFPFGESFKFTIETKTPFKLFIRKPEYFSDYGLNANGYKVDYKKGYFIISVRKSCVIELTFASEIVEHYLKGKKGVLDGVYYSKGVLVYANGQKGQRIIDKTEERQSPEFPAINILPDKEWGYGALTGKTATFTPCDSAFKFDLDNDLPTITISGAKIINAKLVKKSVISRRVGVSSKGQKYNVYEKLKGKFLFTPDLLKTKNVYGDSQTITLYPYGACKIRQTVFPVIKENS